MALFDVFVVIDTDKDLRKLMTMETKVNPYLTIYDDRYREDKKKAWALKSEYGARENPFVLIHKDGQFDKVIYHEATEKVIDELINYFNNVSLE
jgi:hypothetical protein